MVGVNPFGWLVSLHFKAMLIFTSASVAACSQRNFPSSAQASYESGLWGECADTKCWAAARSRPSQCPGHWCSGHLALEHLFGRASTVYLRSGLEGASSSVELYAISVWLDIIAKCRSTNTSPCIVCRLPYHIDLLLCLCNEFELVWWFIFCLFFLCVHLWPRLQMLFSLFSVAVFSIWSLLVHVDRLSSYVDTAVL